MVNPNQTPYERTLAELYDLPLAMTQAIEKGFSSMFGIQQNVLGKTIGIPLLKGVNSLIRFSKGAFDTANKNNKLFLQLNQTLPQALNRSAQQLEDMPGSFEDKLGILFSFQREGFLDVGKSTTFLAGRMKVTGQNVGALVATNKSLLIQGRLNQAQIDGFNKNLTTLSVAYGVSTEKLLEGFGELNRSLGVLSLGGTVDEVGTAISELGAQFPLLTKDLGRFTDAFVTADISQLGILGGIDNLGQLTSGMVGSGNDLRKIISDTANRAKSFAKTFEKEGPLTQRAIKNIVGDLGVMAIQLDDALMGTANRITEVDKLFRDAGIAFTTALEPFARAIGDATIEVGEFIARISNNIPDSLATGGAVAGAFGGALGMGRLGQAIGAGLAGKTAAGIAAKAAGTAVAVPIALKIGVVAAFAALSYGIFKLIQRSNESAEKAANATADNTAALVDIEKKKERDTFGSSRFERLATRALQDNIFRVAMSEAVSTRAITQGFATQAELLETSVAQGLIPEPLTVR